MSTIDYMKIIDIISKSFDADRNVDLTAKHEKIDIFNVVMTLHAGGTVAYRINLHKYELEVIIEKKYFVAKKFKRWLSNFEYDLEQEFKTNVKVNHEEDVMTHHVKLHI